MVYASNYKRITTLAMLLFSVLTINGMVMDNRYLPLFPHLYTGAHKDANFIASDILFMTGGDAYSNVPMASEDDKIIGYPALWGMRKDKAGHLDLNSVDEANQLVNNAATLLTVGPFLTGKDIEVDIEAHLQLQGAAVSGNIPIGKEFSLGWSSCFFRAIGEARLKLNADSAARLNVGADDYASQAQFVQTLEKVQRALDMQDNVWRTTGAGDLVLSASWYRSMEYKWKCRTVDFSFTTGLILPTGVMMDVDNIASIPFGGNGHWGCFAAPHFEFELKDDLKFGIAARLTKRFTKAHNVRVPVLDESPLFAPYKADVKVTPGTTFGVSPYLAVEHIRGGFGVELKYIVTYHEEDSYEDFRTDTSQIIKLREMLPRSQWTQEYAVIKVVYDLMHNKKSRLRPVLHFTWNVPCNYIAGGGVGKTHGISLGCNFNF